MLRPEKTWDNICEGTYVRAVWLGPLPFPLVELSLAVYGDKLGVESSNADKM